MRALARWMARATVVAGAVWALSMTAPRVDAQAAAPDAGVARVRTTVERAPEGSLRRGVLAVPGWAIWVTASLVIAGAALGLAIRIGRGRR